MGDEVWPTKHCEDRERKKLRGATFVRVGTGRCRFLPFNDFRLVLFRMNLSSSFFGLKTDKKKHINQN